MSKIDFPNNPTTGEIYEYAGQKWRWDGKSWNSVSSSNLSSIDITEYQLKDQLQGTVIGDLVPLGDGTIDLGSLNKKFKNLYLDGNSFFFGNSTIIENNGDILLDPNNSGSSIKLNISDISELSDNNNLLSGVDLNQVDTHLNLDSAGDGQVLSYTGGEYRWIDSSAGATGPAGPAGADGVGITNVVDNGDGTLTLTYGDGSTVTTSNLTGPQGDPGPAGAVGAAGPPGADGTTADIDDHLNKDSAGDGQVLSYTGGDYQWIDAGGSSNGYVTLESSDGNLKISGFGEGSVELVATTRDGNQDVIDLNDYEFSGGYLEIHSLPSNFVPKRLEFVFDGSQTFSGPGFAFIYNPNDFIFPKFQEADGDNLYSFFPPNDPKILITSTAVVYDNSDIKLGSPSALNPVVLSNPYTKASQSFDLKVFGDDTSTSVDIVNPKVIGFVTGLD